MQFGQPRMLDFPATAHLLDDEFGVHSHLELVGAESARLLKPGDQSSVLGDVIGGDADRLAMLGKHGGVVVRPHHTPEPGRTRIAA